MDLGQLEVFLTVAREGKFSRAAEKLHRTQSAVSQSIHKLEEDVGEPSSIAHRATACLRTRGASCRSMPNGCSTCVTTPPARSENCAS